MLPRRYVLRRGLRVRIVGDDVSVKAASCGPAPPDNPLVVVISFVGRRGWSDEGDPSPEDPHRETLPGRRGERATAHTLLPDEPQTTAMSARVLDRETFSDVLVNVIPLVILAYFTLLFVLTRPGDQPYFVAIRIGLLVVPFVSLAVVTYVSARIISRADANTGEER